MSTGLFLLTILVPILSQDAKPSSSNNCFAHFDKYGSRFDVCDLQLVTGQNLQHYTIQDSKNQDSKTSNITTDKYKYIFNIGGVVTDMDKIPICSPTYRNHSYCNSSECTNNDNMIPITDDVWAYQIKFTGNQTVYNDTVCYYLSNHKGGLPKWRLINDLNPVEGVILTVSNGDYAPTCGKNREFSIKFQCEDTGERFVPANQGPIYEYELCSYTWAVKSLHGCPTQCPRAHDKICSGNGLCSYDNTKNASRCYCFGQMTGNECLSKDPTINIWDNTQAKLQETDFIKTFTGRNRDNHSYEVTYDLTKWKLPSDTSANYQIEDKFNSNISTNITGRDNFRYYMGIAQKIQIPSECADYGNLTKNGVEAYVIQRNENTNKCYVLGNDINWQLVDNIDDPAAGVTLRYTNGSSEGCFGSNREFSVSLICPDFVMNNNNKRIFDTGIEVGSVWNKYVEEPMTCSYEIEIETATACPYQCIKEVGNNFEICSQHGVCVSDPIVGQVRCLCDDNWHGPLCDTLPTPSPTTAPTPSPSKSPTLKPTPFPTKKPTMKPTNFPSVSPFVAAVIVKTEKDNHTAFIISILGLCIVVIIAIIIGRYCYKKMYSQYEEEKAFHRFRDNTQKKKKAAIGFSMKSNRINVADDSDDEETNEDQLL